MSMPSILESVEWGEPALQLLAQCHELDPNKPAIMHLRHTERPMTGLGNPDEFKQVSTESGKKAAYEFGERLPSKRNYRFYYTYMERTRETVQEINDGILANRGKTEIISSIPLTTVVDRKKYDEIISRDSKNGLGYLDIFSKWISGHYPPWMRIPALEFSQKAAAIMMENLESAESSRIDVYVSHDVFIAAFLLHWFGVFPVDWVQFLDGFIFQLYEEKMVIYSKYGRKEVFYPYWWNPT